MHRAARLCDRSVPIAQISAVGVEVERSGARAGASSDLPCGALDMLEWATRGGPGPLTGELASVPVALPLVVAELAAAQDIFFGRPSRHRGYARGVERALMWARWVGRLAAASSRRGRPR